ncbi:MAG: alpha/beta hydrolase [Bifidobacteriaceae bacterium]|jgi:acetyl esterase|nr:alpha/beta hydrolase [Bifidobacteriaceae bacterium]
MPIDPVARRARRAARRLVGRPARDPAGWRAQAFAVDQRLTRRLMEPAPAGVQAEDVTAPVPGGQPVRLRVYSPSPPGERRRPAILTFFGGGFRQGGLDFASVDLTNRRRAQDADAVIVAVDYALAPEHPFPEAVEQGHAALQWLHGNASSIGADPDRGGVAGASSGGTIAAAVTLMNRDRDQIPLRLQLLEVPALDLTGGHIDRRLAWRLGAPPFLVARGLRQLAGQYLGGASAREPYASPLLAPDLSGLPSAHVLTAEFDLLRGDGEAYAIRLREAGVPVQSRRFEGQTHESSFYTAAMAGARAWQAEVRSALRTLTRG